MANSPYVFGHLRCTDQEGIELEFTLTQNGVLVVTIDRVYVGLLTPEHVEALRRLLSKEGD